MSQSNYLVMSFILQKLVARHPSKSLVYMSSILVALGIIIFMLREVSDVIWTSMTKPLFGGKRMLQKLVGTRIVSTVRSLEVVASRRLPMYYMYRIFNP